MNLKEQLEIIRGESIQVFEGDPMDIPCIETSDAEKLCKNPVVSVHMITYNHEPYIRQAIEGVMMQKTDFEFELIIGEDASQDKTREICFEYQKKHPDKIRVLWWHENVSKLGGNSCRVYARCRGEFIAFCEGDDYWTDPLKLQKQVELIRENKCAGCVAFNDILYNDDSVREYVYEVKKYITNDDYFRHYFHTSTYVFRMDFFNEIRKKYKMPYWYDTMIFHCMAARGRIVLLPEKVSVRRFTLKGIATSLDEWGRIVLNMSQSIPMYLWGPEKLRKLYLFQIFESLSMWIIINKKLKIKLSNKKVDVIRRLLRWCFIKNIFSVKAWIILLRVFVYKVNLKTVK